MDQVHASYREIPLGQDRNSQVRDMINCLSKVFLTYSISQSLKICHRLTKSSMNFRSYFRLSEQALSAGFADPSDYRKIWLAYIDYLRRRLSEDEDNKEQFAKSKNACFLTKQFSEIVNHLAVILFSDIKL